jgi:type I restriction enzyme R subunit
MTENDLEQACIDWFRELGWEYSHGEVISPGGFAPERAHYNEVVLAPRFRAALESLNPDLPPPPSTMRKSASGSLPASPSWKPTATSTSGCAMAFRWTSRRMATAASSVVVFDWTDMTRNDWLIVNQFTVKGSKTVRPDMVAFVNGLPLAVIELKNPADEKADVFAAFNQIQNYKNEIPQLLSRTWCASSLMAPWHG